ncbi:MAG TPA: histidine kinase [Armatimonadota bacterium]|jgi:signal transduction histidine kinase
MEIATAMVRILLVEDNPADADLLQETLHRVETGRYHFTWMECLQDAEACLLGQESFDVLLLDLSLPDSSGSETFQRARSMAPLLPIVLLTGDGNEQIGLEAVRFGIQDYLVKGHADGHQVARAIRYAIQRKQMEDTLKELHAELEIRVCERTAELAQANEALQREMGERIRAEAQQLTAVMEERTRIAREIHDTIAQGLTGIVIQLETADYCLDHDLAAARMRIQKARDLARDSLTEARHSVWALRPHVLEEGDLMTAIVTLIARLPHEASVTIDFTHQGIPYPLPTEMAHELLRLCQEGVTNALKHAQARHIHITLGYTARQVALCVADDGQGFEPASPPSRAGFGLRIMEERVARLGGQLTLTSRPGQGTRMEVQTPWHPETQGDIPHDGTH